MTTTQDHAAPDRSAEAVLDRLRRVETTRPLLWGVGPLVLAVALVLVMMALAPSVAPERIIERPVGESTEVER